MSTRPGYQKFSKYSKACAFCDFFESYDGQNYLPSEQRDYYEVNKDSKGRCRKNGSSNRRATNTICGTSNYVETRKI